VHPSTSHPDVGQNSEGNFTMVTTQDSDWNPGLNSVPWTKKVRPGVRAAGDGRPQLLPASPPRGPSRPDHQFATEKTMSTETRKQRLLREVRGTEESEPNSVENTFVVLVVAVVALVVYWGAAVLTVTSSAERGTSAAQREAMMIKTLRAAGVVAPESTGQARPASNKSNVNP
jgi:hypothetical protein